MTDPRHLTLAHLIELARAHNVKPEDVEIIFSTWIGHEYAFSRAAFEKDIEAEHPDTEGDFTPIKHALVIAPLPFQDEIEEE